MTSEEKGDDHYNQAEKKFKTCSPMTMGQEKFEEAGELFAKAGKYYKAAKKWTKASDSFERSAECFIRTSKYDAANSYLEAAEVKKHINVNDAVKSYKSALDLFSDEGRFSTVARIYKDIAELQEKELDFESCIVNYREAADLYLSENANSMATTCLAKVARYLAQLKRFEEAILIYEDLANKSLGAKGNSFSAKEYYFNAALCHLSLDYIRAMREVSNYKSMDSYFDRSNEATLLESLIQAVENNDEKLFSQSVNKYDMSNRLDDFRVKLLLGIKDSLNVDPITSIL